jgi:hypothetical protein
MRRFLFWGSLVLANIVAMLGMIFVRCDCGGPDTGQVLKSFALGGSLFAAVFVLASLPCALLGWAISRYWLRRRSFALWQIPLAAALMGSASYGYLDMKWQVEERTEASR